MGAGGGAKAGTVGTENSGDGLLSFQPIPQPGQLYPLLKVPEVLPLRGAH